MNRFIWYLFLQIVAIVTTAVLLHFTIMLLNVHDTTTFYIGVILNFTLIVTFIRGSIYIWQAYAKDDGTPNGGAFSI